MPFRKPTEQEFCQLLSGTNWIKQLARKILLIDEEDCSKWGVCLIPNQTTYNQTLCEDWANDFIANGSSLKLTKADIISAAGGLTLSDGTPITNISQIHIGVEHVKARGFGNFISTNSQVDLTYNGGNQALTGGETKSFGDGLNPIADDICILIYDGSILSLSAVFI